VEAMKNPCRRLATPEDSAAAIAWLASDAASFVNGVNLPVTGGPVV
jgi:3-oxoacyl-[acyl-carrier protein] reductase